MRQTGFVGVLGAGLAVGAAFLVVAVVGALGGVPVLFNLPVELYGWEGAQYGMALLYFLGMQKPWLFPVLALTGAVVEIAVRSALPQQATPPQPPAPDRPDGLIHASAPEPAGLSGPSLGRRA